MKTRVKNRIKAALESGLPNAHTMWPENFPRVKKWNERFIRMKQKLAASRMKLNVKVEGE